MNQLAIHINDEFTPEDLYQLPDHSLARVTLLRAYRQEFTVVPHHYHRYANDLPELEWKSCDFYDPAVKIPDEKGVYAFSIQFNDNHLPNNSYIMYIGKGGEIGNKSSIKARYNSYVAYSKKTVSNPKFDIFFDMWRHHITFSYAVLPDNISPGEIEKKLNNILQPPLSYADYTAEVKLDRRGAQL